ncbi:MAG: protein kinase domain-containing protein [Archangium sp.]
MAELDPRFRIRAPLRCDGIGRLDCAEDSVSGERLAVRWVPLDANGELAVKACEKLPTHPTLPRILQTGSVGASAFVALDFPMGETLAARGEERLENEQLLKLAAQLADALATVHAQNVVHGEMSRDSVLLTQDGRAVLWDMPLVIANRLADRRGENRLMQNLVKTAPYLAPERARGEGASQPADVYGLAAVLCIAGGAPLPTASTTLGAVHQVSSGEWSPRVPTSLPEQWRTMLERMLSSDASKRPTAAEVALEFARVPGQGSLPTVPELPAIRLPAEILEAADALMKSQVEAMRAPTRELSLEAVQAAAAASVDLTPVTPTPSLPLEIDPVPSLELKKPEETPAVEAAPVEAKPAVTEEVPAVVEAKPAVTEEVPAAQKLDVEPTPHPFMRAAMHAAEVAQPRSASSDVVPVATLPTTPQNEHPFMRSAIHARTVTGDGVIEAVRHEREAVRIPTVEFEAVRSTVPLNDGIAVSADLLAAGATSMSAEDVAAYDASRRRVWMMLGAFGGAALGLIMVVILLAHREPEVVVVPAPVAAAPAPVVVKPALEELAPLPRIAAPPKPVKRAAPVVAPVEAPKTEEAAAPVAAQPVKTEPEKFEFLDGAEAPRAELKRPEF